MLKRPPNRNQRNKGIRVKHILQVALLLGVCFWLIYQLKHSYEKKAALGENDPKTLIKTQIESELLKLGRKDLPQKDATTQLIREEEEEEEALREDDEKLHIEEEKHEAEEREEEDPKSRIEEIDEEGQKHETEEQEEENKDDDSVDVGKRAEDEDMDENDSEVKERVDDHNENLVDEEKEREDGGDENDSDRNEEKIENREENEKTLSDDQDNEGGDENSHEVREAREEHYKGDDASSAVTHDAQEVSTETEKLSSESSNGTSETSVDEDGNQYNMRLVDHGRTSENDTLSVPPTEEKPQANSSIPVANLLVDANGKPQTGDLPEVENNSSIVSPAGLAELTQATSSHHPNDTETVSESVPSQNTTVDGLSTREGGTERSVIGKSVENVLNSTEIHASHQVENNVSENNLLLDGTAKVEDSSGSSTINEGMHATEHEESKSEDGVKNEDASKNEELKNEDASKNEESVNEKASVNEKSNSRETSKTEESKDTDESSQADVRSDSTNTTEETVEQDPIDSSDSHISEAEKEARTDLDTLPEIQTEGDENGEAAAE